VMAEMYLCDRKPLLPLLPTLLLTLILFLITFHLNSILLLLLYTTLLLLTNLSLYGKTYLHLLKRVLLVVVFISILTLNPSIMPITFLKALSYISISTLLFAIHPPKHTLTHKYAHITLCLLPYLEFTTTNILLSAKIKGVKLSSPNPITRLHSYIKILIPTFTIFMKVIDDVTLSVKIKGGGK